MLVYNGGSISNFLINFLVNKDKEIYVTDTTARATRYANAQATEVVDPNMDQEMAEGTIILEVEVTDVNWYRRPENHTSLDVCEAIARDFRIVKAILKFHEYAHTVYGNRHIGYFNRDQVLEVLYGSSIEVELL